ncbi:MAG: hypothetical protein ABEL51_12285, partial [Salinibacter sp.]
DVINIAPRAQEIPCPPPGGSTTVRVTVDGTLTRTDVASGSFDVRLVDEDDLSDDDTLASVNLARGDEAEPSPWGPGDDKLFVFDVTLKCNEDCLIEGPDGSSGEAEANLALEIDNGARRRHDNFYDTTTADWVSIACVESSTSTPSVCSEQTLLNYDRNDNNRFEDPEFIALVNDWVDQSVCDDVFFMGVDRWTTQSVLVEDGGGSQPQPISSTLQFISEQGQPVDEIAFGDPLRLRLEDAGANADPDQAEQTTVQIQIQPAEGDPSNPFGVTLSETDPDAGVFRTNVQYQRWENVQGATLAAQYQDPDHSDDVSQAQVAVTGAEASMNAVRLSPTRLRPDTRARLIVDSGSVNRVAVTVFNLSGDRVLHRQSMGTALTFRPVDASGQPLANGVYFYRVSLRGPNGDVRRTEVKQLVVMR